MIKVNEVGNVIFLGFEKSKEEKSVAEMIAKDGWMDVTDSAPAVVVAEKKDDGRLKVGDIIVNSWGYSMTFVDYARIKKVNPKTYIAEMIPSKTISGGGMAGEVMPDVDADPIANEKPIRINVSKHGDLSSRTGGGSMRFWNKWDGNPNHYNTLD